MRVASAFSLIEMLVSVSIIVVLLTVMLPALQRSLRQASATVCMHNLRAIDQVVQMYRMENRGWIPHNRLQAGQYTTNNTPWYEMLVPQYIADASLLICPEDPFQATLEAAARAPEHPDWQNASSFGMNEFITASPNTFLANVESHPPRYPADTLLIADMGPDNGTGLPQRNKGKLNWSDGFDFRMIESADSWLTRRHLIGINVLTLGGAVRTVPTSQMFGTVVSDYYPDCAARECTFCVDIGIAHYSFAHARTFWWTGPRPAP